LISLPNILSNPGSQTISFPYYPEYNVLPVISIRAVSDSLNVTSASNPQTQICNCTYLDKNATCLTNQTQTLISSSIILLACSCSNPYFGNFIKKDGYE